MCRIMSTSLSLFKVDPFFFDENDTQILANTQLLENSVRTQTDTPSNRSQVVGNHSHTRGAVRGEH